MGTNPLKNNPPKLEPSTVLKYFNWSVLEFFTPFHFTLVLELFNLPSTGGKKHENTNLLRKLIIQYSYQQMKEKNEIKGK